MMSGLIGDEANGGGRLQAAAAWAARGSGCTPGPPPNPASAPRRPRARERAPRSCIRQKAVRVCCHKCHGTGRGRASAPCPPPQQPALGRDGSPVHRSPRVAPRARSSQPGSPGAKAPERFSHPAVPDGAVELCSAGKKHGVANSRKSLHSASSRPFVPLRLSFLPLLVPNLRRPRDQLIR